MKMDAQCELIIEMDVMQVIGLDLHNLSKTIVWNGLSNLMTILMMHDCMNP
jgi:hypothetical protein